MIKEIGHVALRVKNYETMTAWVEKMGLTKQFRLMNKADEERIGYFGLEDGRFIELFPQQTLAPHGFHGENRPEDRCFRYAVVAEGDTLQYDAENNGWKGDLPATGLYEVVYHVKRFREMVIFYEGILRLHVIEKTEDKCVFELPSGQRIVFLKKDYEGNNDTEDRSYHHIALITDDIFEEAENVERYDIKVSHGSQRRNPVYTVPYREVGKPGSDNSYAFYLLDPEKNDIEIMQYTENSMQVRYSRKK